ncbi:hypothetical protein MTO96_018620 [Rhipicephalus appendiculatus]
MKFGLEFIITFLLLVLIPSAAICAWWIHAPFHIPGLAQSLLDRIGFAAQGVRAGSAAARFQARFRPYTRKGSIFRALQRWRRDGIPQWLQNLVLRLGVVVLGVIFFKWVNILVPRLLFNF